MTGLNIENINVFESIGSKTTMTIACNWLKDQTKQAEHRVNGLKKTKFDFINEPHENVEWLQWCDEWMDASMLKYVQE